MLNQAGTDEEARNLINQAALANGIQLNTISLQATGEAGAFQQMSDNTTEHRTATEDSFVRSGEAEARTDTRADIGRALTEARTTGDTRALSTLFANFCANDRAVARDAAGGNPANPGNQPPNPGAPGAMTRGPMGPMVPGSPTPTPGGGPPNPGGDAARVPQQPLATRAQPRMDSLQTRIANLPEGHPLKEQAKALESRLRAAISSGNHEEIQHTLGEMAALFENSGETDTLDDIRELRELTEGEGDGEAGGAGRRGTDGDGGAPRRVARTFTADDLSKGFTVFAGGDRGGSADGEDHLTRMGTGLRVICGGMATGVATARAVRGTYAEDRGDDSGGSGGRRGGGAGDAAGFGAMVDPSGTLAARGYGVVDAAGPMGNFAVRGADGRIYGMYDSRLPADCRPGVRDWVGVGTMVRARAISGGDVGRRGEMDAAYRV